jgi:hypothetical protein
MHSKRGKDKSDLQGRVVLICVSGKRVTMMEPLLGSLDKFLGFSQEGQVGDLSVLHF